jgi:transcriptional regulator GlxA family with amidase domain
MNLQVPAAFLRRLHLNEARTPLRNTRLPLDEIAMRSGFYSSKALDVRLPENLR